MIDPCFLVKSQLTLTSGQAGYQRFRFCNLLDDQKNFPSTKVPELFCFVLRPWLSSAAHQHDAVKKH